ncbi:hypothetical protein ACOJQI_12135 [Bacillus salacetis]|uniref:hypothetical protein n=1 Tax=Bacillus salacetis TaxID=2315464 RepID=UPI003BA1FCE8
MWWLPIMIVLVLLFAWFIDFRRKKRGNDKHIQGNSSSANPGESNNYHYGERRD